MGKNNIFYTLKIIVALIFAAWGFLIFIGNHYNDNGVFVSGEPQFSHGIIALVITLLLWSRGILDFRKWGGFVKAIFLCADVAMIASIVALFFVKKDLGIIEQFAQDGLKSAVSAVIIIMMLLGSKNLAKLVCLICLIVMGINNANQIDIAYGIFGFLGLMFYFVSIYIQGSIDFYSLSQELSRLYGKGTDLVDAAAEDGRKLASTAVNMAISGKVPGLHNEISNKSHEMIDRQKESVAKTREIE